MPIYFATNRNILSEDNDGIATFGNRFNADGPQVFRVGVVDAAPRLDGSGNPLPATGDEPFVIGPARLYPDTQITGQGMMRGSQVMFDELRERLRSDGQDVLIYLHGFASEFDTAIQRAASLEALYNAGGPGAAAADPIVLVFSWPSNGISFPASNYFSDRDDAEASGLAMARALLAFIDFMRDLFEADRAAIHAAKARGEVPTPDLLRRCNQRMHLLAHSMGNWALRHAVLALSRKLGDRPLPRIFKNVLLVAADEDADALGTEAKLGLLLELAQNIHVYHSQDDLALQISDTTKGNPDRLGIDGPKDLNNLAPRVFTVDCSLVDDTILSHGRHQYYRIRPEVTADITEVLKGTKPDLIPNRELIRPGRSWRIQPP